MIRPTLEVADVFRRYGDAFLRRFSTSLTTAPGRALSAIERCRSAALGGQIERCDHCGHCRFCYRSCRNRHCPKRQGKPSPDLSGASGFRLYSMVVDAAVKGMGTAIGHPAVIAREAGVQAFREGRRAGNRRGEGPRLWPY